MSAEGACSQTLLQRNWGTDDALKSDCCPPTNFVCKRGTWTSIVKSPGKTRMMYVDLWMSCMDTIVVVSLGQVRTTKTGHKAETTILAKIMWDKLAECTASTIDQFFTWKQTFFGPNPTFPPSPHAMLFERLAEESSNIASGGRGERANIAAIREKGTLSHTFWPGL